MNDLMTKSFLNYVELKKQAMLDLEACNPPAPASAQEHPQEDEEEQHLALFFAEVEAIQQGMEAIFGLLLELRRLTEETRTAHSGTALRGLRERLDSGVAAILRKASAVRARLGALDRRPSAALRGGGPADNFSCY